MRTADADRDRGDVHVAVIDVPAVGAFGIASAGELGYAALKRGTWRKASQRGAVVRWFGVARQCGLRRSARQRGAQGDGGEVAVLR